MKLKICILLAAFVSCLVLSNCKKGKDDPAFTLRTRKNRITGEWRMKSGHASFTILNPNTAPYDQDFTLDGTTAYINETESNSGPAIIYVASHNLNLTIKKDGTFNIRELLSGDVMDVTGRWNFTSGVGKEKNKEEILFIIESISNGATDRHVFNKLRTEFTYKITELKNKEMKFEAGTKTYLDNNGDHISYTGDFIFSQR